MALETASYPRQLNPSNPSGADRVHQGDDHIRMIKAVLKTTFPNLTGPLTVDQDHLNRDWSLPVGMIVSWYGDAASVPEGWALCNGQTVQRTDTGANITLPDLRDRVLVGAGGSYAPLDAFGATSQSVSTGSAGAHGHTISGGAHTHTGEVKDHTLTEAQVPRHSHGNGVSDDNSRNIFPLGTLPISGGNIDTAGGGGTVQGITTEFGGGGAHKHDLQINEATHSHTLSDATGHTHSVQVSTLQPSLALHFIMKV